MGNVGLSVNKLKPIIEGIAGFIVSALLSASCFCIISSASPSELVWKKISVPRKTR